MADDETTTPPAEPAAAPEPAPAAEATPAPVDPAPAAEAAPSAPAAEAPPAPAEPAPAAPAEAPAAEAPSAPETPAAEASSAPETPAAEAPSAAEGPAAPEAPAGDAAAEGGDKPKRRRSRGGSKVAKAWGVKAAAVDGVPVAADLTPTGEGVPAGQNQQRRQGGGGGKGKGGPRPNRGGGGQRPPREKGPLPFDDLREAARTIVEIHGKRTALRDAFGELAQKERDQLAEIVKEDGDFRVRARAISAGSLSAGKIGKALAAQQIAIADVQDLWTLTLSKEDAAERQSWVRNAKRRDEDRAKRQKERSNRDDRIAKEDMAKARDGHVTAKARIDPAIFAAFGGGDAAAKEAEAKADAEEKKAAKKKKAQGSSVLDRLGY